MAIREVLVSFTFEQQRQMLNLIGADVGDASLLLTPTNVVVTAINEVITGDVDLSNQTIGMDDGTLASPSLFWDDGQGFYKVDANKLGLTTSLAVTGNLEVDGDITFRAGSGTGGTLTFGDLDTDNIVINADVQSSIVPDSTANYNLGTVAKQWNNLWIDGTASIDTLEVDLNTILTGDLSVNSGIIKVDPSTATTATIFNDYVATASVLMDATAITIGSAAAGTLMIRNSNITTPKTTINVFNSTATTVNAFGAASNVITGFSTFGTTGVNSNFNIRSDDTVLDGDLNVNGGEILSSENTFDLLINNNDVRIGASNGVGETIINNSLKVTENVNLANSGTNVTIKDNTANALAIKEGANTYITFQTTDASERVIVYKDLYVVGNLDISGTTTTIDTTTLTVEDKNIELGTAAAPTDALADGGGITLKGTTDKTITYSNANTAWESNIGFNIAGNLGVSGITEIFGGSSTTGPGGVLQLSSNDQTISAADEVFGSITFKANDLSTGQTGVFAKIDAASNRLFDGDNASGMDLRFYAGDKGDGVDTPPERLRITSGGEVQIANGNLKFSTSGTGIDFSATANSSGTMSSEILDDYEEGTFTPNLDLSGTSGSLSIGYSNQTGRYVKVGRIVHFTIDIRLSSWSRGSGTGGIMVQGLPFTPVNSLNYSRATGFCNLYNWDYSAVAADIPLWNVYQSSGQPWVTISKHTEGAINSDVSDPGNSSMMFFSGTYEAGA